MHLNTLTKGMKTPKKADQIDDFNIMLDTLSNVTEWLLVLQELIKG